MLRLTGWVGSSLAAARRYRSSPANSAVCWRVVPVARSRFTVPVAGSKALPNRVFASSSGRGAPLAGAATGLPAACFSARYSANFPAAWAAGVWIATFWLAVVRSPNWALAVAVVDRLMAIHIHIVTGMIEKTGIGRE